MNPLIGSHVDHQGKTFIVGRRGRLYAPRTSIDAWGRTRQTQKVTKYRIVTCGCGKPFIAHDGRMKTCPDCQAQIHRERRARLSAETPPSAARCRVCGQPLIAQCRTQTYCSRACQQKAYRERCQGPKNAHRSRAAGTGKRSHRKPASPRLKESPAGSRLGQQGQTD